MGTGRAPTAQPARPLAVAAAPRRRRGFPLAAIPPLAAALALIATTAYAIVYGLIEWGNLEPVDAFLTGAAPSVLGSPFVDYGSFGSWLSYAPFGGGWAIVIPFLVTLFATMLLAALSRAGAGGRIASGCLVAVPMALFTIALTLLNYAAVGSDYYYSDLGTEVLQSAGGAAIAGFLGGTLGALLSLPISPPAGQSWHGHGQEPHRPPITPAR